MTTPVCSVCALADEAMKNCKDCGQFYCSVDCQKWDWTEMDHASLCDSAQGEREFIEARGGGRGHLTPEKAHEMLRHPPHGRPLTPRQKRYFGWVYGSSK